MAKKIICKNCNTEIIKDDIKCFNCGELNPNLNSYVVEGIISGVLAILFSKLPLLGFLSALCGFTYSNKIKRIEKFKNKYILILVLTIIGLVLTLINWLPNFI